MLEVIGAVMLFFFIMVLAMFWLGIRLARRLMRHVRSFAMAFQPGAPRASPFADPRWLRLSAHLDRPQREQSRIARERIAAFLAERRSTALTPEEAQLMISCEKRVPELIDACLERCSTARPGERCDYATATLERLARIGQEADAARQTIRSRDDGRLLTMHNYFDALAPANGGSSAGDRTLIR